MLTCSSIIVFRLFGNKTSCRLTTESIQGKYGPVPLNEGLTAVQAMFIEAIVSFNLVFAGLCITSPNSKNTNVPGLATGLAIFVGAFAAVGKRLSFCQSVNNIVK